MREKTKITLEVDKNYYELASSISEMIGIPLESIINAKIHEIALGRNINFYAPTNIPVSTAQKLKIEKLASALDDRFDANLKQFNARLDNAGKPDAFGDY